MKDLPPRRRRRPSRSSKKFLKGFYGTLDVSLDDTTKGIRGLNAYHWSYVDPTNPNSGYVQGGQKGGPVGSVGYIGSLSTNKSVLGYRGSHKIDGSNFDFIYQIETQPSITSSSGTQHLVHAANSNKK